MSPSKRTSKPSGDAYHHGDLRPALLAAAVGEIERVGPSGVSLRSIARSAGVSHAAPQHHFGDKAGLFAAIAAEGYSLLADATDEAWRARDELLDMGLAYVRFALDHRAHFEVMFRPELYGAEDPEVLVARNRAAGVLFGAVGSALDTDEPSAILDGAVGVWAFVHGLASLWLEANFLPEVGDDPEAAARSAVVAIRRLFDAGAFDAPAP